MCDRAQNTLFKNILRIKNQHKWTAGRLPLCSTSTNKGFTLEKIKQEAAQSGLKLQRGKKHELRNRRKE